MAEKLNLMPISLKDANDFVSLHHRHHKPVIGHKFSISAYFGEKLVAVCIVGRPVSRHRDNGLTLEVTRMCSDGTKNACSFLYGAASRATFSLGYKKLGTYTTPEEGGASLKASNWRMIAETPGKSWSVPSRQRNDSHPLGTKLLWEINNG